jgi:hypothetical protein
MQDRQFEGTGMNRVRTFRPLCVAAVAVMFGILAATMTEAQVAPPRPTRVRLADWAAASITTHVVLPDEIGIPGDVVVEVLVEKNGQVRSVRAVSGDDRLLRVARPAVMNWVFQPYSLQGEPMQFSAEMTIHFDGNKGTAKLKVSKDPRSPGALKPKSR